MLNLKRIFDPLYGAVSFSDEEYELISSSEMQRLRYVRLCNINSLLITGASEISRFEHCLGVLALAKHWSLHNKQAKELKRSHRTSVVSAALLHDIQTGPFGHSLQYVFEDNKFEEHFLHDDVKEASKSNFHQLSRLHFSGKDFSAKDILDGEYSNVADLIKGKSEFGILISGTIDLDNLDNVFRLAYHVGIIGRECVKPILSFVEKVQILNNYFVVPDENVKLLELWYETRKRLYELLLLDWAEFSAKAMLTRAIEYASPNLGPDAWLYTDDAFVDYLENDVDPGNIELKRLIKRLKLGDLFYPISLLSTNSVELYPQISSAETKRKIEGDLKTILKKTMKSFSSEVLFHPILDVKKTCRKINYINSLGKSASVGEDSSKIHIGVFVSKERGIDKKVLSVQDDIIKYFMDKGLNNINPIDDPVLGETINDSDEQREFEW